MASSLVQCFSSLMHHVLPLLSGFSLSEFKHVQLCCSENFLKNKLSNCCQSTRSSKVTTLELPAIFNYQLVLYCFTSFVLVLFSAAKLLKRKTYTYLLQFPYFQRLTQLLQSRFLPQPAQKLFMHKGHHWPSHHIMIGHILILILLNH